MNICVFASGAGSNFKVILDSAAKKYLNSKILLLITNNPSCGAVEIAKKYKIDFLCVNKKIYNGHSPEEISKIYLNVLKEYDIDFIVLSGYMKIIDKEILKEYKNRIINIHPALLPSFGGKGMFGMNVHKAVIASGVKVSGITIHFVNEYYDEGEIIFQKCCEVNNDDDEFTLQKKIQKMEHEYYFEIIKKFEEGKVLIIKKKAFVIWKL